MRFLLFALISAVCLSCDSVENVYEVKVDMKTQEVIMSYIKENDINLETTAITCQWVVNTLRKDVYIASTPFIPVDDRVPSGYVVLPNKGIVLIYSGLENSIIRDTSRISSEVQHIMNELKIRLKPDQGLLHHPPTWLYTVCVDGDEVIKDSSNDELFYLPCHYSLLQKRDSLFVVRKNH